MGGSGSFDTDTMVDVSSEIASLAQNGVSVHLTVTSVSVTPVSGIQDFGFLDSARLDVISSASPSSLVAYQRDPQAAPPTQLTLEPSSKVDLADALVDGQARVAIHISGALPTTDWSVAVKTCFEVSGNLAQ